MQMWTVGLNLPIALLPQKSALIAEATTITESRGGYCEMTSEPAPGSSVTTFGAAFAFEAGDVNAEAAVRLLNFRFEELGGTVDFDPEDITWSSED